jgi:hypothetical protein
MPEPESVDEILAEMDSTAESGGSNTVAGPLVTVRLWVHRLEAALKREREHMTPERRAFMEAAEKVASADWIGRGLDPLDWSAILWMSPETQTQCKAHLACHMEELRNCYRAMKRAEERRESDAGSRP